MAQDIPKYLPDGLAYSGVTRTFLQNGALIYPGGAYQAEYPDNIERTTPECTNIADVIAYTQANEQLMVDISAIYAQEISRRDNDLTKVRIQRRVVDSVGNRKACHDNFSVHSPVEYEDDPMKRQSLVGHLATRSFIVGAGHVTKSGLRYAQKINGLVAVEGYGNIGFMFRAVGGRDARFDTTGERLEVRCGDINISPWAITMRLGATGLLMASLETPLKNRIYDMSPAMRDPIESAKEMNTVPMDDQGCFRPTRDSFVALDFQERLADMYLNELGEYTELPDEYFEIALELKVYRQDYRKVLANEAPISLLANRSDMAAKFARILSSHPGFIKDPSKNILAMRDDLLYDHIGIEAMPGERARARFGYGYRLRQDNTYKYTVPDLAVARAYVAPPNDTRAFARGTIIKNYHVSYVEWDRVEVPSEEFTTIHLTDPLNPAIDARAVLKLEQYAALR